MEWSPNVGFKCIWKLTDRLSFLLGECCAMLHSMIHTPVPPEDQQRLRRLALVRGAQATTAIEGNTLSQDEVARVERGERLAESKRYQEQEVRNVLSALVSLVHEVTIEERVAPITPELIRRFHRMIGSDLGPQFDAIPGEYRQDMRSVGGYLCPDHRLVPKLVEQLCNFLEEHFKWKDGRLTFENAVIEAIVAHAYLEWIHPFGDGNGRTGRLLEAYLVLRAGIPDIGCHLLSNHYNQTRTEYYWHLDTARKTADLTGFLEYAVQGLRDGILTELTKIQESQFGTAWRAYVASVFESVDAGNRKRPILKRRRRLAAMFPTSATRANRIYLKALTEIPAYRNVSLRAFKADLEELRQLDLIREESPGHFVAKREVLRIMLPARLQTVPVMRGAS